MRRVLANLGRILAGAMVVAMATIPVGAIDDGGKPVAAAAAPSQLAVDTQKALADAGFHARVRDVDGGLLVVDQVDPATITLGPLAGHPIAELDLHGCTALSELDGLQGMPLTELDLVGCAHLKGDLSALRNLPLRRLNLSGCGELTSLSGIEQLPLQQLIIDRAMRRVDISAAMSIAQRGALAEQFRH